MNADNVLMEVSLSLSREPAERRPGCEDLLQPRPSCIFSDGTVFEGIVDGRADGDGVKQRLQKPEIFAFEPLVVDRILMTVDGEEDLFWRQHGNAADVPGFACGTGIVAGRVTATRLVTQLDQE